MQTENWGDIVCTLVDIRNEEGDDESDEDPWYIESEPFVPEMVERSRVCPWDRMVRSQPVEPGELLDDDTVYAVCRDLLTAVKMWYAVSSIHL